MANKRSLGKELIDGMKSILKFIKSGKKSDPSKSWDSENLRVTLVPNVKVKTRKRIKVKRHV